MAGIVLKVEKEQMDWFRHFLRLDREMLAKANDLMPGDIDNLHQVFAAVEYVIARPMNDTWLEWLANGLKWLAAAISRLLSAQAKMDQLKNQIIQVDAILVAIERKLPVQGTDLAMGQYIISWANLCIARKKRQLSDKDFYFSCGRLRTWLAAEMRVRGERTAA